MTSAEHPGKPHQLSAECAAPLVQGHADTRLDLLAGQHHEFSNHSLGVVLGKFVHQEPEQDDAALYLHRRKFLDVNVFRIVRDNKACGIRSLELAHLYPRDIRKTSASQGELYSSIVEPSTSQPCDNRTERSFAGVFLGNEFHWSSPECDEICGSKREHDGGRSCHASDPETDPVEFPHPDSLTRTVN
jgi:hypothetical protein